MKILEINKFNYPKGGADRHFLDVVKLLQEKGHRVAVFSMEHPRNEFSPWKKYFVSRVGYAKEDTLWQKIKGVGRMFYSFEARRNIKKLLDDFQPDIAHIHNIYHQISPSILPEIKKRGIPVVMTLHDYESISPDREEYFECVGRRYWKFIFSKKYNFTRRVILAAKSYWELMLGYWSIVDLYISPSEFARGIFVEAGIPENRVKVLGHFLSRESTSRFQEKPTRERYAFYFGRISESKGARDLIDIFKRQSRLKLYLAGEAEGDFSVEAHGSIRYLGYLDRNEIQKYISGSECVVSASKLPETFGLIALEAMEQGKPFIALEAGAYSEIVTQGSSGFICHDKKEFEEVIRKIADKEISFDNNAIQEEAAKRYGRESYEERLLNIFHSIL